MNRVIKLPIPEKLLPFLEPGRVEVGLDEAGRGCLAGPVVAAAVILPNHFYHPDLNDSKKINEATRNKLAPIIKEQALAWAIGLADNTEIDRINILKASHLAMHRALNGISQPFTHLLIDGNRFTPFNEVPFTCLIKGDGIMASIAAASVLAKTYRDALMGEFALQFPEYQWHHNKAYPTIQHRKAIAEFGPCHLHRKTFKLLSGTNPIFPD
jgi:ribonuclease HII